MIGIKDCKHCIHECVCKSKEQVNELKKEIDSIASGYKDIGVLVDVTCSHYRTDTQLREATYKQVKEEKYEN